LLEVAVAVLLVAGVVVVDIEHLLELLEAVLLLNLN
jgi:hypothetical protein